MTPLNGLKDFADNLESKLDDYDKEFIELVEASGIDWEYTQNIMADIDYTQALIHQHLVTLSDRNSVTEMIGRINLQFQYLEEGLRKLRRYLERKSSDKYGS